MVRNSVRRLGPTSSSAVQLSGTLEKIWDLCRSCLLGFKRSGIYYPISVIPSRYRFFTWFYLVYSICNFKIKSLEATADHFVKAPLASIALWHFSFFLFLLFVSWVFFSCLNYVTVLVLWWLSVQAFLVSQSVRLVILIWMAQKCRSLKAKDSEPSLRTKHFRVREGSGHIVKLVMSLCWSWCLPHPALVNCSVCILLGNIMTEQSPWASLVCRLQPKGARCFPDFYQIAECLCWAIGEL